MWNAAIAAEVDAADLAACADSVMFCFSKGLGAPVGSILAGPADFIAAARQLRARLGGAMRQVGVIAAAAEVALHDRARIKDDHALAHQLATCLAERFPGAVDPTAAKTNMVVVHDSGLPFPAERLVDRLAAEGVLTAFITPGVLRFCTHRNVDGEDVARVLAVADTLEAE